MSEVFGGENLEVPVIPQKKVEPVAGDVQRILDPSKEQRKLSEYIDEALSQKFSDLGLEPSEQEEIIKTLLSQFGSDKMKLDTVLQGIIQDETLISKDDVLENIKKQQELDGKQQDNIKLKENYDSVKSILSNLKGDNSRNYENIIKLLNKNEFNEVLKELKNPVVFNAIASDLQAKDPIAFQNFELSLTSIDSSFKKRFEDFRGINQVKSRPMLLLGTDNLSGVNLASNTLTQKTPDGFVIEAGAKGRKLSLEGGDYALPASLDNGAERRQYSDIEKRSKIELKGINETLNSVSQILDYISLTLSNNTDINEVKDIIESKNPDLYMELGIERFDSVADIQKSFSDFYKQKEEQKDILLKAIKSKIADIVRTNAGKAMEKDRGKKETLRFISSIGFDAIPQSITDSVISQLNANSGLRARLGFNSVIDLANGQLGFNSDNDITQNTPKEKADFAKVFNRMIGGNDSGPIDPAAIGGVGNPVKNPAELSGYLETNGYKNSGIAVGQMIKNLSNNGVEGEKKEK